VEKYAAAVERGAQAVLLSSLLTTTMPYMKDVIARLKDKDVKILVGGAPVTQEYADSIGAHGYGRDANDAVREIDRLFAKTA
jgi:5-methyltetrahydrofolate--homocysteine methyltransferase